MATRLCLRDERNFPLVMVDLVALREAGVTIFNRFTDLPGDIADFRQTSDNETNFSFEIGFVDEVARSDK